MGKKRRGKEHDRSKQEEKKGKNEEGTREEGEEGKDEEKNVSVLVIICTDLNIYRTHLS